MQRISLEEFRKKPAYEAMTLQGKKAVVEMALEGISLSEDSLALMIQFDKGELTKEEYKKRIIERATNP